MLLKKIERNEKIRGENYNLEQNIYYQMDGRNIQIAFFLNRAISSSHAHNPVNWYPWGDEAFETAKKLNRPVLLSVGYSTCHWCHVMEEESFEDEEIARYLNKTTLQLKLIAKSVRISMPST